jgi:hypothetical protein
VGIATALAQIGYWVSSWAPEELYGGLKGRSAEELHERMQQAIDEALAGNTPLAGCKLDLRKCFDTVSAQQAIHVLRMLGLPEGLAVVLEDFYGRQRKWVECKGAVARDPITCGRGILQGCPASCLLLAGIMAAWVRHVQNKCPGVDFGVYLDDRSLWTSRENPEEALEEALLAAKEVDDAAGLELHPDKGESWAVGEEARGRLRGLEDRLGPAKLDFKLVGIRYHVSRAHRTPLSPSGMLWSLVGCRGCKRLQGPDGAKQRRFGALFCRSSRTRGLGRDHRRRCWPNGGMGWSRPFLVSV